MKIKTLAVATAVLVGLLAVPVTTTAVAAPQASPAAGLSHGKKGDGQKGDGKKGDGKSGDGKKGDGKGPQNKKFRVAAGVTLTDPFEKNRGDITNKIVRVINHTPKGSKIRAVSWNFSSNRYVKALTAAHNRGVSVRIIMARTLANDQGPEGSYNKMRRNLAGHGNATRPQALKSWIRTCDHSCRGKGGAMHAKYYIFSQAGATKQIVMNTSANLTASSSVVQWNDLITVTDRPVTYKAYMEVFNQMMQDKRQNFYKFNDGSIYGFFYPRLGRRHLALEMLDKVKCGGARDAGVNGKTAIRVAMDVFNNDIGNAIAKRLLQLKNRGCNVKVVYSQAVGASKGPVNALKATHLVQDRDGDGAYDRYLHSKVMTISGNYDGNRSERIVMNGSGNWSGTAIQSDEQGMIVDRDFFERQYGRWINEMYNTHLVSAPRNPNLRTMHLDPYRNMES